MTESPYEISMRRFDWRDEVKKLGLLIDWPIGYFFDAVTLRGYMIEKLAAILAGVPISLDAGNQERFNRWKRGPERIQ